MTNVAKDSNQLFDNLPKLMTPKEVADFLRVDRRTIYRWIHAEKVHAHKNSISGDLRIELEEVRKLMGMKG